MSNKEIIEKLEYIIDEIIVTDDESADWLETLKQIVSILENYDFIISEYRKEHELLEIYMSAYSKLHTLLELYRNYVYHHQQGNMAVVYRIHDKIIKLEKELEK